MWRTPTKQEKLALLFKNMGHYGISYDDAAKLRRIEMTLQRWAELECGDSNKYSSWAIERDEETDKSDLPHERFTVVRNGEGWTIQRKGSDSPYSGASRTKAQAKEFAARETLSSYYTRGLAACV